MKARERARRAASRKRRPYKAPKGTRGVFARVSDAAYEMLVEAARGANDGRGLGNGNRVTMGTVLERCIVQTLGGEHAK